jgi:predicted dehydrogenase
VGLGYWGPNLARNVSASERFHLTALVDRDRSRLDRLSGTYPAARTHESLEEAVAVGDLDLVAIATPVSIHAGLAKIALAAGCHVLAEKPFTATLAEAREVMELADSVGCRTFVDHTFLFTGAVRELKQQIVSGELGDFHFVDSVRINLGLFQPDVDVLWDLAPHDLSILQHLIGRPPSAVRAIGAAHNPAGFVDDVHLHLDYGSSFGAHLHLSWLSPVKVRRMIFAGTRQFAIYDDLEPAEKIKYYDHGVEFDVRDLEARRKVLVSYRRGEMRAPAVPPGEALALEMTNVADAIEGKQEPVAPGSDGALVVAVLEAASRSLAANGDQVDVNAFE